MRISMEEIKKIGIPDTEKLKLIYNNKMCPHCFNTNLKKSRKIKLQEFYHWEDEEYYYQQVLIEKSICACGCECIDEKWHIPEKYVYTQKQDKTIDFINKVLYTNFVPITKNQSSLIISNYLKQASMEAEKDMYYCSEWPDYLDLEDFF